MLLKQLVRGSAGCNSDQSQLPLRLSAALPPVFSLAVRELPVFRQSVERWGHEGYRAGRPEQETWPAALEATLELFHRSPNQPQKPPHCAQNPRMVQRRKVYRDRADLQTVNTPRSEPPAIAVEGLKAARLHFPVPLRPWLAGIPSTRDP
jgi:hypothetical protein